MTVTATHLQHTATHPGTHYNICSVVICLPGDAGEEEDEIDVDLFDDEQAPGVLQCVAVRCSVLQCVAVHCSALQCVAVRCSVLQYVAVRCSALQCAL